MGCIGCIRSKKLRSDFVARAFALNAPVQPVLHWVYFHNKTIPNAPKHYETHQNMSLWSYGVDWVCSLRANLMRLRGTNYCIKCTSSAILHRVSCSNEMIPSPPKHHKTHQNMSLGSDGLDRVDLLQKLQTRLCGTNFCINCNISACFEPSIIMKQNGPKCTQTLRNTTKHEFWVQWCGSCAFVAKNSNATSWHELLQKLHHTAHFASSFMQ